METWECGSHNTVMLKQLEHHITHLDIVTCFFQIQRTVAYSKVSKDIGKWDQVVKANRKVEHMSFPLNQAKIGIQSVEDFSQRFKVSELRIYVVGLGFFDQKPRTEGRINCSV